MINKDEKRSDLIIDRAKNIKITNSSENYYCVTIPTKEEKTLDLLNQFVTKHNNNLQSNLQYKSARGQVNNYNKKQKDDFNPDEVMLFIEKNNLKTCNTEDVELKTEEVIKNNANGALLENYSFHIKKAPEAIIANSYNLEPENPANILATRVEIKNIDYIRDSQITIEIQRTPIINFRIHFDEDGFQDIGICDNLSSPLDSESLEALLLNHINDLNSEDWPEGRARIILAELYQESKKTTTTSWCHHMKISLRRRKHK